MSSRRAKVLLVEDDLPMRALYSQSLLQRGYWVESAEDGFSALAEIRRQKPDVVVSDLNMPGMSGFELLSVIRRRFPEVQVVAMSGSFSGKGIPPGVAADAFYEKGRSGLNELLDILETMTHPDRLFAGPKPSKLAPIWVPGRPNEPGDYFIVTCPECLRAFASHLAQTSDRVGKVDCVYCTSPIQYDLEESSDRQTGDGFTRKTGAGTQAPILIPCFS